MYNSYFLSFLFLDLSVPLSKKPSEAFWRNTRYLQSHHELVSLMHLFPFFVDLRGAGKLFSSASVIVSVRSCLFGLNYYWWMIKATISSSFSQCNQLEYRRELNSQREEEMSFVAKMSASKLNSSKSTSPPNPLKICECPTSWRKWILALKMLIMDFRSYTYFSSLSYNVTFVITSPSILVIVRYGLQLINQQFYSLIRHKSI